VVSNCRGSPPNVAPRTTFAAAMLLQFATIFLPQCAIFRVCPQLHFMLKLFHWMTVLPLSWNFGIPLAKVRRLNALV